MNANPGMRAPIDPELEDLRTHCPISRTPEGRWFLASHGVVRRAAEDIEVFHGSARDPDVQVPEDEKLLSEMREPRHGAIRKVINSAIAAHRIRHIEPMCTALCEQLLGSLRDCEEGTVVDLYEGYISPVPNNVIAHLLGADPKDYPRWARWSDEVVQGPYVARNGSERGAGFHGAHPEFSAYLDEIIADRRRRPRDRDFVSRMLEREVNGKRLTDVEARIQLLFLFIAGNATTRHLFSSLMYRLATDRELFNLLKNKRELVPAFVEESLRLDPPVRVLFRECSADTNWMATNIKAGEKVDFGIESANRDEKVFSSPHQMLLDRPNLREHLSFGAGPHQCPGATLARMEARIAVEVFLNMVKAFRIETHERLPVSSVWWVGRGPEYLPVKIDWETRRWGGIGDVAGSF